MLQQAKHQPPARRPDPVGGGVAQLAGPTQGRLAALSRQLNEKQPIQRQGDDITGVKRKGKDPEEEDSAVHKSLHVGDDEEGGLAHNLSQIDEEPQPLHMGNQFAPHMGQGSFGFFGGLHGLQAPLLTGLPMMNLTPSLEQILLNLHPQLNLTNSNFQLQSHSPLGMLNLDLGGLGDLMNPMHPGPSHGLVDPFDQPVVQTWDQSQADPNLLPKKKDKPNPYIWDIRDSVAHHVQDPDISNIMKYYGHPTTQVQQAYIKLGDMVGHDSKGGGKLTPDTEAELEQMFDAMKPLHFAHNQFLNKAWTGNLSKYTGGKKDKELYGAMRTQITGNFEKAKTDNQNISLNEYLKEASGKPAEIHHVLYKSLYPGKANDVRNLVLAERSQKESDKAYGPGQHELYHIVSSGRHKDKFKVEKDQFIGKYKSWANIPD
jgi:hypothetical protein